MRNFGSFPLVTSRTQDDKTGVVSSAQPTFRLTHSSIHFKGIDVHSLDEPDADILRAGLTRAYFEVLSLQISDCGWASWTKSNYLLKPVLRSSRNCLHTDCTYL